MNARLKRMVGHGAILMIFGLVAGFGLVVSLIGGFEAVPGWIIAFDIPGDSGAWARTHTGGLMNGIMVFVFALVFHAMKLPDRTEFNLYWMLVGAGYGNTIFYWGGMLAPSRALSFGDNRLGESNLFGVIGLLPALIFAYITIYAMFVLARHAFASARAR